MLCCQQTTRMTYSRTPVDKRRLLFKERNVGIYIKTPKRLCKSVQGSYEHQKALKIFSDPLMTVDIPLYGSEMAECYESGVEIIKALGVKIVPWKNFYECVSAAATIFAAHVKQHFKAVYFDMKAVSKEIYRESPVASFCLACKDVMGSINFDYVVNFLNVNVELFQYENLFKDTLLKTELEIVFDLNFDISPVTTYRILLQKLNFANLQNDLDASKKLFEKGINAWKQNVRTGEMTKQKKITTFRTHYHSRIDSVDIPLQIMTSETLAVTSKYQGGGGASQYCNSYDDVLEEIFESIFNISIHNKIIFNHDFEEAGMAILLAIKNRSEVIEDKKFEEQVRKYFSPIFSTLETVVKQKSIVDIKQKIEMLFPLQKT